MPFKIKVSHSDDICPDENKNAAEVNRFHRTAQDEEKKGDHMPETLQSFLNATSLHGARFLYADNLLRRILWGLAILASFSVCCYQSYLSMKEFYQRPFITKITSKSPERNEMIFPAVTLCNFNIANMKKIRYTLSRNYGLKEEEVAKKADQISRILLLSKDTMKDDLDGIDDLLLRDAEAVLKEHGHQIDEMLLPNVPPTFISCSFDGLQCGATNFTSFISSFYGQCFTFNSGRNGGPLLKARMAGKNSELKLRLNIQKDAYLKNAKRPFAGVAVLVHDQKNFPFMEEVSLGVAPGIQTFYSFKMKQMRSLEAPYQTNCTQRTLQMLSTGDVYNYTKLACLKKCENQVIVKKCGCRPPMFYGTSKVCAPNNTVFCVFPALESLISSEEQRKCEEDCPLPCEEKEYESSLSYARLERNIFAEHLVAFLKTSPTHNPSLYSEYQPFLNMTTAERRDFIDNNIVSLDVYFSDLHYLEFKQVPSFAPFSFIATLGGFYGLFLGASMLSWCEIMEYCVRKIYHKMVSTNRRSIN